MGGGNQRIRHDPRTTPRYKVGTKEKNTKNMKTTFTFKSLQDFMRFVLQVDYFIYYIIFTNKILFYLLQLQHKYLTNTY